MRKLKNFLREEALDVLHHLDAILLTVILTFAGLVLALAMSGDPSPLMTILSMFQD